MIGLYRVTVEHNSWNGLNVNVFHFSNDNVGPDSFGSVATTLLSGFYSTMETVFPTESTFGVGQIIDLSTNPPTYVPFDATPFDVTCSGSRGDARQAATITWRSTVATRSGRGRSFIGPLNVSSMNSTSGLWDPAFVTVVDAAAFNLRDSAITEEIALQVYSRKLNARYPVVGHHVPVTPHTLRSRTLE